MRKQWTVLVCLLGFVWKAQSQGVINVTGKVVSGFTQEPLPYATLYWKTGGYGCMTDSIGHFSIRKSHHAADTLMIRYVGYIVKQLPAGDWNLSAPLQIELTTALRDGVEVKSKLNKGQVWWRQIVKHKPQNAPGHYNNYHARLYNKLEIDVANLHQTRWQHTRLMRPFSFALQQIDSTTEKHPFLPVFLSETLSDYYTSATPLRVREEIQALHASGVKNESVMEYLGGINQKINTYADYMQILGREFISPVSVAGDKYYHYKGLDTVQQNGEQYFHLSFTPKREGENLFSGDCWIQSSTWALQKISMTVTGAVNINFVKRLDIIQEFSPLNQKEWAVTKDRFIVELSPLGKNKTSFIARKTTLYQNIHVNEDYIGARLDANTKREEVVIADSARSTTPDYWNQHRPESLTANEKVALTLVDTLKSMPAFKKLSNTVTFLFDGHIKMGKLEIGPWYKWLSYNQAEGLRLRFDLGTTAAFSQSWRLYGYLAYGTKDKAVKGKIAASYEKPGTPWRFMASYKDDLDNVQRGFNGEEVTLDNIFGQAIRRKGIPQKFIREEEIQLSVTRKLPFNFSLQGTVARNEYTTYAPLPPHQLFRKPGDIYEEVVNTSFQLKARYAPGEKELRTFRKTRRIRSNLPVAEVAWTLAPAGVADSKYYYQKITMSLQQRFRIPRWGQISYMAYAGKIFSDQLPFMLLQVHPGNETYYYNREAFNLLQKYELLSDQYAGVNIEHNFDGKLLHLLPFMRKTGVRQFWHAKAVVGSLSRENKRYNRLEYSEYGMRSLNGQVYAEVGTGFDNIFRFFRIDGVWRFSPYHTAASQTGHFSLFGSFRLQF
ncbi:DUF5686 and carboxypeptidase regulatory-like domain-containing protein [Chitinophaga nivalis]|uniref:DUF5686 and carboxypeptidase regulatory-like domain-containing protein n=1 Tax=Chitinophaga nivalis TaxID=2991709 RepID=A0ABT3IGX6_9BACT|nr:DUF5686 and carboxypeptidase regulatory-like domain-containing protein [Chitinophaga nivalis]MCW3467107.1 DUF5686 and carboxypeptidase regulatory-like domain-containing protein [Chitinophaga nivalis]MCW3483202.1 DUF5686 and carboxypeptidase regulatory-like domain-containing protein [Chitinophaga nivalis]